MALHKLFAFVFDVISCLIWVFGVNCNDFTIFSVNGEGEEATVLEEIEPFRFEIQQSKT